MDSSDIEKEETSFEPATESVSESPVASHDAPAGRNRDGSPTLSQGSTSAGDSVSLPSIVALEGSDGGKDAGKTSPSASQHLAIAEEDVATLSISFLDGSDEEQDEDALSSSVQRLASPQLAVTEPESAICLEDGPNHVGTPAAALQPQLETRTEPRVSVSSITFHDLSYEVPQRKRCKKLPNKTILNSVSGEMKVGVNAIMGPTGSGKTTLLDLLADRKDKSGRTGKVLVNGQRRPKNFKTTVGYVVQDDVVMGTLSVRENLEFSAALRLPGHTTREQRKKRVQRVIETLGLYRCASTKIGTEFFRGVSGGERRRTNIGMELIIEPQVVFLDEPTTGLDAHTAVSVISLLKDMSVNENRMIILSIHQPRYSIFKLFDSLSLLSQGEIVYHGQANLALDYFDRLGFTCEQHDNPADFFLDVIIRYEKRTRLQKEETVHFNPGEEENAVVLEESQVHFVESYRKSAEYQEIRKSIDPLLQNVREEVEREGVASRISTKIFGQKSFATNFFWEFWILTRRSAKNLIRSPASSVAQLIVTSVLAVIIGTIYWQLDTNPNGFTDRIGIFFFIVANQSFGSLGAIELFIAQKSLFIHENSSGYYRVSSFFISKIITDLFALRVIPNTLFAVITYFMIGFQLVVEKFFIYWLVAQLVNFSAVSIAFLISAGVRNGALANVLIVLPFIISLLFAGVLISLDSLPVWVSWFQYLSFMRYATEAFFINEMDGLTFRGPCQVQSMMDEVCAGSGAMESPMVDSDCRSVCVIDGLSQLAQLGYSNTMSALWWDVFALVVYSMVCLLLAYIVLRLIKKEK